MSGIRLRNELLFINLCSGVLVVIVWLVDIWVLRLILGLPFLLFFPGYALMATLFPRRSDLGALQRVALSIAFSLVLSPAIGFALNFLWRLELYPILAGIAIFTAIMSALAWIRRRPIPEEERPEMVIALPFAPGGRFSALDKTVSMVLFLAFLAAIAVLVAVVANPKEGERYSGFYLRGAQSRPTEVPVGAPVAVTLGITNHETETMTYRIQVRAGNTVLKTTDPIRLDQGAAWENEVSFTPIEAGGTSQLTQDVPAATDNIQAPPTTSIRVSSVERLSAGDNIWVGQEAAVVKAVSGDTVTLLEALEQAHATGTDVIEVHRIELRLLKVRQIGGQSGTSLALWVGKDGLEASVSNLGQAPVAYQLSFEVGDIYQTTTTPIKPPVQTVPAGQVWTQQADYQFSENHEIGISLFRDGKLAYRSPETGCYPSLFLWVHVA